MRLFELHESHQANLIPKQSSTIDDDESRLNFSFPIRGHDIGSIDL